MTRAQGRRILALATAVALAMAAGCSLLVDAGSYTAGPHGIAADAAPRDDAQGDAGDAGSPQGCARYADASFCHDFDDAKTALSPFVLSTFIPDGSAGTVSLVMDGAVSAPNAARLVVTAAPANACADVLLTKAFPGRFGTLTARVSVRAETEGIAFSVVAAQQEFQPRSYRVLLTIRRSPTDANVGVFVQQFESGSFSTFHQGIFALQDDPFTRSLDLTVVMATSPTPSILVRAWDRSLVVPAPADLVINDPDVEIGPYCQPAGVTFTYDDLAIWAGP